ncbi:MAG: hypothetical protein GTO45_02720, partial [Candidatus Aminicenantes bacterium]|nr:hypothetical protein [Candidatus Aminicenantes bacterium]NIM77643.1 hypothetical protein [Candidatus Aminicenantes bacterium]NIN16955.1 hypothetical protein [Candidatus Aminicenantes bacterium]NIN40848.1 hypothetical protein [Candidatus Aminicenantes bacterium]NIN83652.1 hypothetical protein [Candidatus Aminicenantes bacterium]
MAQSKQDVKEKILSFSHDELKNWIRSRLHGEDRYFSIYLGHETNLRGFLSDVFNRIENKEFRDDFIKTLNQLINEIDRYTKDEIEEDKVYIYELFTLCGTIKQFEKKVTLFQMAKSGKFKRIQVHDTDLHLVLLTALSSYRLGGNYKFWIEQMKDDSNKYYTNAAFYALLENRYSLDILFKHLGIFIDRFKEGIELVLGIESLFDDREPTEIYGMFKKIESRLSNEQKQAVNHAFKEAGYEIPYKPGKKVKFKADEELLSKVAAPQPQYVAAPTPKYKPGATLKEKALEIFKLMGYEVELNRQIAGHSIDIFLKKKKSIGNRYECWICFCDTGKRQVGKAGIDSLYPIREAVREELEKQPGICDDCQAIIISEKGFTKVAIEAAKVYHIELKTLDQLLTDLRALFNHEATKDTKDHEEEKKLRR